jgi:hypothetical protein
LRDYWDVVCDEDEESTTYKLIKEIEAELAKPCEPVSPPEREPLTEREIDIATNDIYPENYIEVEGGTLIGVYKYNIALTRAIERAHGITVENEKQESL